MVDRFPRKTKSNQGRSGCYYGRDSLDFIPVIKMDMKISPMVCQLQRFVLGGTCMATKVFSRFVASWFADS